MHASERMAHIIHARHPQETPAPRVSPKDWATPGVTAALRWAVTGMDTGLEAASPRIQEGLRRIADDLAGGVERMTPRLHEGLERVAPKVTPLAGGATSAGNLNRNGGTSRKIWLFAGLLAAAAAGGFTAWRTLRAADAAAAGTEQEQVSRDMDRAAAGLRHAADDLRSQVSQLTVQLRNAASGMTADVKSQASHLAAGMKPGTRRAGTPDGNAAIDPELTADDQG